MVAPVHDPVRDVTLLNMVRYMPVADFLKLCDDVLNDTPNTVIEGFDGRQFCDTMRLHATPCDTNCRACGEPIEPVAEVLAFTAATGLRVCKTCVDEALALIFGPGEDTWIDQDAQAAVRSVIGLAAIRRHA
jgi:hypothetical protein